MSAFSHGALQKAIYEVLLGDATLTGVVNGVYDRVIEQTNYPYITLGEASGRDWSTKTELGMQYIVTLHVFSRNGGRKQASQILEHIHTLLHEASLSLVGHTLVSIRFLTSDILLENDGMTYHGIMRLRAITQQQ